MKISQIQKLLQFIIKKLYRIYFKAKFIPLKNKPEIRPFILTNKQKHSFINSNISPGKYKIIIQHNDPYLYKNKKSLFVSFHSHNQHSIRDTADEMNVNHNNRFAFQYLGGGKIAENGTVTSHVTFNIKKPTPWMIFSINTILDRYININEIIFAPADEANFSLPAKFFNYPDFMNARSILYADIDLNVIDGSSVWLSSMASILCAQGLCILVAKKHPMTDVIVGNITHKENLCIIDPQTLGQLTDVLNVEQAINVVRQLDALLPSVQSIVVRGLGAAYELSQTRQFKYRSNVYLTDFYEHIDNDIVISGDNKKSLEIIALHAERLLVQTTEIASRIQKSAERETKVFELPPPVFTKNLSANERWKPRKPIKIGYAGKIAPKWGIYELLDWVEALREKGLAIEVTIISNKISGLPTAEERKIFRAEITERMQELNVIRHDGMKRDDTLKLLTQMDYVWCYRPSDFEETTLELSTKLVESVASGFAAICYPNSINKRILGDDYSYFVKTRDDLEDVISRKEIRTSKELSDQVFAKHGIDAIASRFADTLQEQDENRPNLLIAGHDLKFIDSYYSHLKSIGHQVTIDHWEWGKPADLERTLSMMKASDVIFCEWGLANAVWYSRNIDAGKKLIIRIHLQEINERAKHFGEQINFENVDTFIFVSERVRQTALQMWNWPEKKTVVIPNFVLDDEYILHEKPKDDVIRLGMVGIIPQRKRLDRAITLLENLLKKGHKATLSIKGPKPETLAFMHAPSRAQELVYYQEQYDRIKADPQLRETVTFNGFGNDVAQWYRDINVILSPSDFESFHYALADGVLSGCLPVIWPWDEATIIYDQSWIVTDDDQALKRILEFNSATKIKKDKIKKENRRAICHRYGKDRIFAQLTKTWEGQP